MSASAAFLKPARGRANLTIWTGRTVERVILRNSRATGVKVREKGGAIEVGARREVILSGGALHSPMLLQLSGIGPAPVLSAAGIELHTRCLVSARTCANIASCNSPSAFGRADTIAA